MKICFAFPNKKNKNKNLFYIFQAKTKKRLDALAEYTDSLYKENLYNNSCSLLLFSPDDFKYFLKKNNYDYGLMCWNDIVQEFYITPKSLNYE